MEPKETKDQGSEPSRWPNGAYSVTQDLSKEMLLRTQAPTDTTDTTDTTDAVYTTDAVDTTDADAVYTTDAVDTTDADAVYTTDAVDTTDAKNRVEKAEAIEEADATEEADRLLERQALRERAQRRGGWGGFVWSMTPSFWSREGRFWWTDFVLIFVINFLVQLILYALWTAFFPQAKPSSVLGYTGLVLLSLGGQIVIGLLYVQIGRNIRGLTWKEMFWAWPTLRMVLWWVLIFFPSMMVFSWVYVFVLGQLGIASPKQAVAGLFHASNPIYLHLLAIVMVVVGAPIAEELLYRGVLFHALEPMWGMQRAALGSGLIFGLVHLEAGTILPLGFLGYLLARAYAQSRSLWVPIFLHSVNNWIALIAVYLGKT